jgi:hypothetical protein
MQLICLSPRTINYLNRLVKFDMRKLVLEVDVGHFGTGGHEIPTLERFQVRR